MRPRKLLRRLLLGLGLLVLLALALVAHAFGPAAAGYAATVTALVHLGGGQPLEQVEREWLRLPLGLERLVRVRVDAEGRSVEATAFGIYRSEARWRPGLGATRTGPDPPRWPQPVPLPPLDPELPWPRGSAGPTAPVAPALAQAVELAFAPGLETHALLVARDGALLVERYSPGIGPDTPLLGWSMTKTLLAALLGRAMELELLPGPERGAPVPEWRGDDRGRITLEQLLRMTSGLEFWSDYSYPWSDSIQMLFVHRDLAGFTASKPLVHEPGRVWSYSDGTSNLLARIVGEAVGGDLAARTEFLREEFLAPLRMTGTVLPVDPAGHWVGSSFALAPARDWARLGQLLLDDGRAGDQRLLPEGWVEFLASRTPQSPHGCFGAHLWRYDRESGRTELGLPTPPELLGALYASGHGGQFVLVHPDRRVVVVRLGAPPVEGRFPREEIAAAILRAAG